ncbi:MAG TPA: hypothetical protein EYP98_07870 [Planctomycetes bacterium]|nr:hypothetical protein [Planctomycetota bacterium]
MVLADAFQYIWHKRLLAEEMMRLVGAEGVVTMPHLHSALGANFSAGDTLTPAAYHALFASHRPRLFSDDRILDDVVEHGVVDLTRDVSPEQLGAEASLTLRMSLPMISGDEEMHQMAICVLSSARNCAWDGCISVR